MATICETMSRREFLKRAAVIATNIILDPDQSWLAALLQKTDGEHANKLVWQSADNRGLIGESNDQVQLPIQEKEAPQGWRWVQGVRGRIITGLYHSPEQSVLVAAHEQGIDEIKIPAGKETIVTPPLRSMTRNMTALPYAYNIIPDDRGLYFLGKSIGYWPPPSTGDAYEIYHLPEEIDDSLGTPYGILGPDHKLWALARSPYLLEFNPEESKLHRLPTQGINMTIAQDPNGKIWIGTLTFSESACGLGIFDPDTAQYTPLEEFYGLSVADLAFHRPNNKMIAGGDYSFRSHKIRPGGIHLIDPGTFQTTTIVPPSPDEPKRFVYVATNNNGFIYTIVRSFISPPAVSGFDGRTIYDLDGNILEANGLTGVPILSYTVDSGGQEFCGTTNGILTNNP